MFKFIIDRDIEKYFYIEIYLLSVTIFSQIFVVVSIYYLFVTDKEEVRS